MSKTLEGRINTVLVKILCRMCPKEEMCWARVPCPKVLKIQSDIQALVPEKQDLKEFRKKLVMVYGENKKIDESVEHMEIYNSAIDDMRERLED